MDQPQSVSFRFTGTAGEYFRIWIVNLLLTVLTLGVYSAWAKVRRKQYFYRHTFVSDTSFEYLANPIAILKGRLLIVAVLVLVGASEYLSTELYGALIVLVVLSTPWVLVRALSFNARNSAYRNVRFAFQGTTGDSYRTYLVAVLVYVFTLGLGFPYMQWKISDFVVKGHRYGNLSFGFRSTAREYFGVFIRTAGITMLLMLLVVAVMFGFFGLGGFGQAGGAADQSGPGLAIYLFVAAFYAVLIVPGAYAKAHVANLFWGGMDVGPHRLESTQTFKEVLWLVFTNLLGVVFSLGLAIPWAIVRSLRYRVDHLTIHASGPLVVDVVQGQDEPGAFGDAATDLGDFDFDFG